MATEGTAPVEKKTPVAKKAGTTRRKKTQPKKSRASTAPLVEVINLRKGIVKEPEGLANLHLQYNHVENSGIYCSVDEAARYGIKIAAGGKKVIYLEEVES